MSVRVHSETQIYVFNSMSVCMLLQLLDRIVPLWEPLFKKYIFLLLFLRYWSQKKEPNLHMNSCWILLIIRLLPASIRWIKYTIDSSYVLTYFPLHLWQPTLTVRMIGTELSRFAERGSPEQRYKQPKGRVLWNWISSVIKSALRLLFLGTLCYPFSNASRPTFGSRPRVEKRCNRK